MIDSNNVGSILFDEAWFAYAHFHSLYKGWHAMSESDEEPVPEKVGPETSPSLNPHNVKESIHIFATQSTHKVLAALSQGFQTAG